MAHCQLIEEALGEMGIKDFEQSRLFRGVTDSELKYFC